MLNIVLVEPEIPQNTGNIARTCACVGARLHLVEPMGFRLTERNLKRAGCDYWDGCRGGAVACVEAFLEAHGEDELHLFTGQATCGYRNAAVRRMRFCCSGARAAGSTRLSSTPRRPLPAHSHAQGARSLNLSNAVAIAAYEALAQRGFPGLV